VFGRVGFDIAIGYCLLQSLMKDTMEIADGLGRKPFLGQGVVVALNGVRAEGIQFDGTQAWLNPGVYNSW
jgi:hypothetical protein